MPMATTDVVDTFSQAVRILHLDHPLSAAPALVGTTPSLIGEFEGHGRLVVGAPARLIVFNARTINEIVSRPQSDRVVIDRGERVLVDMTDYSELWQGTQAGVLPDNSEQGTVAC